MRAVPHTTILVDAYQIIEEVATECRDVVDGAEGGRAETQRIQTLDETASTLEGLEPPEIEKDALSEAEGAEFPGMFG